MSIREQIRKATQGSKPVEVSEWGTTIYIRLLSVAERDQLLDVVNAESSNGRLTVWVCLFALADQDGVRLYSATPEDYAELASQPATVLDRLGKLAMEHNLMIGAAAVEEAKKN